MKPPNFLLVVTDQQHPDLLGCAGKFPVRTPHLDALAADGTRFTRGYTPCPLCTPARASLLTGQYPSRHGAWSIGTDLDPGALSLPALLRERAGYRTAIIGKSHFQSCLRPGSLEALPRSQDWEYWAQFDGPWYGFDHARICVGHGAEPHAYSMHYGHWLQQQGVRSGEPYFIADANERVGRWDLPAEFHQSRWIADEAIAWLDDAEGGGGGEPFFLSVNFTDPHLPFLTPAPWDEMYAGAEFPPLRRQRGESEGKPTLYRATLEGRANALGWNGQAGVNVPCQRGAPHDSEDYTADELKKWRAYCGMMSHVDHHLGRILEALERRGLAEDTVVVFTSDHGDAMGEHWLWSKGGSHYDAVVRVPLIVRAPGRVPSGTASGALQSLVDVAPTFMALAGLEPAEQMQGIDQSDVWRGRAELLREGVLIDHRVERGLYVSTWITDEWRLSLHNIFAGEPRDEWELYSLTGDRSELENLAGDPAYDGLRAELAGAMMRARLAGAGPWRPRLSFA